MCCCSIQSIDDLRTSFFNFLGCFIPSFVAKQRTPCLRTVYGGGLGRKEANRKPIALLQMTNSREAARFLPQKSHPRLVLSTVLLPLLVIFSPSLISVAQPGALRRPRACEEASRPESLAAARLTAALYLANSLSHRKDMHGFVASVQTILSSRQAPPSGICPCCSQYCRTAIFSSIPGHPLRLVTGGVHEAHLKVWDHHD